MNRIFATIIISLILLGCSSDSRYPNRVISISDLSDRPMQIVPDYRIGIGDTLQIDVWKNPDLGANVPVRPDGKISAPLVGDVAVAGKTPEQVAQIITRRLAKYVRTPNVAVIMTELGSTTYISRVRVTGAVEQSSSLQHSQGMTVLDAVLAAGGPNEFADAENTRIFRRIDDETAVIRINLQSILVEGNLSDNIQLLPGDTITVPERRF